MRAPRFSSGSLRSNSLAIVTPSLQTIGEPHFFSIKTDFDRGPSVTRIASVSWVAPRKIFSRAIERNRTCLCAMDSPHHNTCAALCLTGPRRFKLSANAGSPGVKETPSVRRGHIDFEDCETQLRMPRAFCVDTTRHACKTLHVQKWLFEAPSPPCW